MIFLLKRLFGTRAWKKHEPTQFDASAVCGFRPSIRRLRINTWMTLCDWSLLVKEDFTAALITLILQGNEIQSDGARGGAGRTCEIGQS